MIEFRSLKHQYANSASIEFSDTRIDSGDQVLITGKSGSGKTSLLHITGGLLKPTFGEVIMETTSIYKLSPRKLDSYRGKNIGIVFQRPYLIKSLTVIENILAALYFSGKKVDNAKALLQLRALNIEELKDKRPFELSHGQAQRVSVARAVINCPEIILADEPTSSLDDENCFSVIKLLQQTAKGINASLLVTSHDNRLKACFEKGIHLEMQKTL
ncbi:MAG: ATP-binding cassette domain-containing protein [Bacteroidetes bacterium]|nr:ATP-binding cassette domain-containing protein [Bacteroidota bacterium]HET6242954.1 ATP-binding cassette domain-containing protein [Bacteroidia bacterium]